MKFIYDDGGRAQAGFRGSTRDCVARAIAIATQMPYREVYDGLNEIAKTEKPRTKKRSSSRTGVHRKTYERFLRDRGWEFVTLANVGSAASSHMRADELPKGRIIVRLTKHLSAVVDHEIHDIYDPSFGGERRVYGYFREAI